MDDIMSKLQNILSTKEGQEQLKNLQSMFGGMAAPTSAPAPEQQQEPQQAATGTSSEQTQGESAQGGFDFSAIASMLSGMNGNSAAGNSTAGNSTAGNSAAGDTQGTEQGSDSGMPNIDINMIMKLQQAFSSMNTSDKNSQLLLALKPHFSEKRSKKVDQAITMMRLFSMLPMLKESGILGSLGSLTGLVGL